MVVVFISKCKCIFCSAEVLALGLPQIARTEAWELILGATGHYAVTRAMSVACGARWAGVHPVLVLV